MRGYPCRISSYLEGTEQPSCNQYIRCKIHQQFHLEHCCVENFKRIAIRNQFVRYGNASLSASRSTEQVTSPGYQRAYDKDIYVSISEDFRQVFAAMEHDATDIQGRLEAALDLKPGRAKALRGHCECLRNKPRILSSQNSQLREGSSEAYATISRCSHTI